MAVNIILFFIYPLPLHTAKKLYSVFISQMTNSNPKKFLSKPFCDAHSVVMSSNIMEQTHHLVLVQKYQLAFWRSMKGQSDKMRFTPFCKLWAHY